MHHYSSHPITADEVWYRPQWMTSRPAFFIYFFLREMGFIDCLISVTLSNNSLQYICSMLNAFTLCKISCYGNGYHISKISNQLYTILSCGQAVLQTNFFHVDQHHSGITSRYGNDTTKLLSWINRGFLFRVSSHSLEK